MSKQFDELAKAMASGMSRREALRRFGGGLFAAILAPFGLAKSAEALGVNCAQFCAGFCGDRPGTAAFTLCVQNCQFCNSRGVNLSPCCPGESYLCTLESPSGAPCCSSCGPGNPECCINPFSQP